MLLGMRVNAEGYQQQLEFLYTNHMIFFELFVYSRPGYMQSFNADFQSHILRISSGSATFARLTIQIVM
jgi:hypothetical protein